MNKLAIDELPDLCLRKIFRHFSLKDLSACRSVSRLFKHYADYAGVQELVVNMASVCTSDHWYQTDKPIKLEDLIDRKGFLFLNPSQFGLFELLKFLCIHLDRPTDLNFGLLNDFRQLVHLQIRWLGVISVSRDRVELALPNLKVLSIRKLYFSLLLLKIPNLEVLEYEDIEKVKLKRPRSIRKLESDYAGPDVMAKFKNLEVFTCKSMNAPPLLGLLPSSWEHLKELNFDLDWDWDDYSTEYEQFRTSLADLLNERAASDKGEDLKIYLNNVLIHAANQLESFDFMGHPSNFHFKYYRMIRPGVSYPDKHSVNYNQLIDWVGEVSSDFFEKFPAIDSVKATAEDDQNLFDPDQFGRFLKSTSCSRLSITESVGQAFMNNLPNVIRELTRLEIIESHPSNRPNFDFVLNFKSLSEFRIGWQQRWRTNWPLDFAEKMFRKFPDFYRFQCQGHVNSEIEIKRDCSDSSKKRFELVLYKIYVDRDYKPIYFYMKKLKWPELKEQCEQRVKGVARSLEIKYYSDE